MPKVATFVWFSERAIEAAHFYVSIFQKANVPCELHSRDTEVVRDGAPTSASFAIRDQEFIAFNGGPHFALTPAVSVFVDCDTQSEVDYFWNALSEGGETSRCGWLKDKFGLSWQVVPKILPKLLADPDRARADRVLQAMLKMQKLDFAQLQRAHDGE
jgi:predicted 3-demethylubiquinone-9 3-methyltransferase (glyoxalase superfamily)